MPNVGTTVVDSTLAAIELYGVVQQLIAYAQSGQQVTADVVKALLQGPLFLLQQAGLNIDPTKLANLCVAVAELFPGTPVT